MKVPLSAFKAALVMAGCQATGNAIIGRAMYLGRFLSPPGSRTRGEVFETTARCSLAGKPYEGFGALLFD